LFVCVIYVVKKCIYEKNSSEKIQQKIINFLSSKVAKKRVLLFFMSYFWEDDFRDVVKKEKCLESDDIMKMTKANLSMMGDISK
jgi:hypothetical protein